MYDFLKKKIVTLCLFKKKIKFTHSKFINGYASWLTLLCFGFCLQIISLLFILTSQNVYLLKANRQNVIDLSCVNQAKQIIDHNRKIRICKTQEEKILEKDVFIDDIQVHFEDKQTYIACTYIKQNRTLRMRIYYDDKSIVGIDIDEN